MTGGNTTSLSLFMPDQNTYQRNSQDQDYTDIFLSSFSQDGELKWIKFFGSGFYDDILDLGYLTQQDQILAAGYFNGDLNIDQINLSSSYYDGFLIAISKDGTDIWGVLFSGDDYEEVNSLDTDQDGNIVIAAKSKSNSLSVLGQNISNPNPGKSDIFVVELDANHIFKFGKAFGGDGNDVANSISFLSNGYIVVAGSFASMTFDAQNLSLNNSSGKNDGFLLLLDQQGNPIDILGIKGAKDETVTIVKEIAPFKLVFAGTSNSLDISINEHSYSSTDRPNSFIGSIDYNDTGFGSIQWFYPLNTDTGNVDLQDMAIKSNEVTVIGGFYGRILNIGQDTLYNEASIGNEGLFLLRFDQNGNLLLKRSYAATDSIHGTSIVVRDYDSILCGKFYNYPVDFGKGELTNRGEWDIFLLSLGY